MRTLNRHAAAREVAQQPMEYRREKFGDVERAKLSELDEGRRPSGCSAKTPSRLRMYHSWGLFRAPGVLR